VRQTQLDGMFPICSKCSVMFLNLEQFNAFADAAPSIEMPTVIALPVVRKNLARLA
jgi:hypothetical protein